MFLNPDRNIRLVIFDFDGVLVESNLNENPFELLACFLAREFSISDPNFGEDILEKIKKFKGGGSTDWISELGRIGINVSDRKVLECISDYLFEISWPTYMVFNWVGRVVSELSSRTQLAICSNNCRKTVNYTLETVMHHFSCVKTYEDVKHLKPHPQGINDIAAELGIDPADILFIGDSKEDVTAAREAGTQIAIASWGQKPGWIGFGGAGILQLSHPELLLKLIPEK